MKKLLAVVCGLVLCANISFATDLSDQSSSTSSYSSSTTKSSEHGQFGIGYSKRPIEVVNAEFDQAALRYWIDDEIGVDVALGFAVGDANSSILFDGKFLYNIVKVRKLDVYLFGGLGLGSYDPKVDGQNSAFIFMLQGGAGVEYFLLPCLSLLTEVGLRYSLASGNGSTKNQFSLFADWLPQAGIRFYF